MGASSSHGLAIADVLEPPAAKRVKGKGKGKNRVPVIPKEEPVLEEEEEEAGERSKSDVIVISSDDSQEQELVNKPQTTKSKLSLTKKRNPPTRLCRNWMVQQIPVMKRMGWMMTMMTGMMMMTTTTMTREWRRSPWVVRTIFLTRTPAICLTRRML